MDAEILRYGYRGGKSSGCSRPNWSDGCCAGILWSVVRSCRFCFFFQAEDGIRDYKVTGVQTCALPICDGHSALAFCEEALAHLSPQNLVARAEVAYAKSLAYHALGDIVPAIQSAREAIAHAQAVGPILAYMCRTAYSLRLHGKLHEVVQIAQLVATRGTTSVGLPHAMVCWAYSIHADVLREWNRLDEALFLALQGVHLSEQTEMIVALYFAYSVLMRVYQAQGEMEAARLAFQKSEATLAQNYSLYRRSIFLIVEWVQFWLSSGEADRAIRWAQELVQQPREPSPLAREREDVARARILCRLREREDRQVPTGYVDTLLAAFSEVGGAHKRAPERGAAAHDGATGAGPL